MTVLAPLRVPFNLMYLAYRTTGLALFVGRELVGSFSPAALPPLERTDWPESRAA